ncbi:hypothetical protein JW905_16350 [bacterium]|nr:hypothetical protein [candidate division CSSED10-310 bacterium]
MKNSTLTRLDDNARRPGDDWFFPPGSFSALRSSRMAAMLHRVFLVVLVLCVRGPVLDDPFILDDFTLLYKLADNQGCVAAAFELYSFARPGETSDWLQWWASSDLKLAYFRPFSSVLLWLERTLWRSHTWLYHVDSLLLYVGCVLLLHALLRRMWGAWTGCFGAALFAVAPAHLTAVQWVANRVDIVSAWWLLLALLLYQRGLRSGAPAWRSVGPVTAAFLLGVLAKESAVLLPVALPVFHFLFMSAGGNGHRVGPARYRFLAVHLACQLSVAGLWSVYYMWRDYGVRSGYFILTLSDFPAALGSMFKAALLYSANLLFFVKISETHKHTMWTDYLTQSILLVTGGVVLICLLVYFLRRRFMLYAFLYGVFLVPALPFQVSDRLGFFDVAVIAMAMSEVLAILPLRIPSRGMAVALGVVMAGSLVVTPAALSWLRAVDRDQWCQDYQVRIVADVRSALTGHPEVDTVYFLNLASPIQVVSLTHHLRLSLGRPRLNVGILTAFEYPPQIMLLGGSRFRLRSATGKAFFQTFPERLFLTESWFAKETAFRAHGFSAEVVKVAAGNILEMEYSFERLFRDPRSLFLVWGDSVTGFVPYSL